MFLLKTTVGHSQLQCIGRKRLLDFLHNLTPSSYKIGLIKYFIHSVFKISSSYIVFHNEINKIKNILEKNAHLIFVIDSHIKKFLEIKYTTKSNENTINRKFIPLKS